MYTFEGPPYCMVPEILIENNQNPIIYTKISMSGQEYLFISYVVKTIQS
jgi:hypothetical protein